MARQRIITANGGPLFLPEVARAFFASGRSALRGPEGKASLGTCVKRALSITGWLAVFVLAAWLRFDRLSVRPFHCDEATGARITAKRLESRDYRFDPAHFHGPTLSSLGAAVCLLRGENRWSMMEKGTLRWVPAIAGILVAMAPWLGRRRWGNAPMLLAGALLATSPLLVYYSRMFIHEMLLVLFGVLVLFAGWGRRGLVTGILAGLWTGLMFATKESFVISLAAWGASGLLLCWENREKINPAVLVTVWREARLPLAAGVLVAAFTSTLFYTDGFRHLEGAWNALRTYFVYQTTEGHEKGFGYYFALLLWPKKSGGVWWCEALVGFLAVWTYAASFWKGVVSIRWRLPVRFLAYSAAGHFLIYGLIRYKTPWLICLPWAHVCLLAGFGIAFAWLRGPAWRWNMGALVAVTLATQVVQARQAIGRLASDDRNPYAYVPTSQDIEALDPWLRQIGGSSPGTSLEPIGVIGSGYWPLPWYLGRFEKIGYWPAPPPDLDRLPVVFAVSESIEAVSAVLSKTHTAVLRGLRSEEPIAVFVRNDLWEHWMSAKSK